MDQREKLIEMLRYSLCSHKNDCTDCKYKKYELCVETMVADYLLANGVVVLPCKVGTMVYEPIIYCDKGGVPFSKCYVGNSCDGCGYYISKVIAYPMTLSDAERLGEKTVFLTREEAEEALAKRKGGNRWNREKN